MAVWHCGEKATRTLDLGDTASRRRCLDLDLNLDLDLRLQTCYTHTKLQGDCMKRL